MLIIVIIVYNISEPTRTSTRTQARTHASFKVYYYNNKKEREKKIYIESSK